MQRHASADLSDPLAAVDEPSAVLVVEDDPDTRESVVELLATPGRDVCSCGTGAEALALVRSRTFSLALLDLSLPDCTGIEILKRLRGGGHELPVVVVSGADSIDSAISAMRLGVSEFLRKPYDPQRLVAIVEKTLDADRLRREHRALRLRLEHSERLHRYLVDRSPDLIYTLDEDGCFRFVNDRFEQLLGYARTDLVGERWEAIVHEDDVDLARWVLNERRTGSRAVKNVELRFRRADGDCVTVVVSATGMYSGDDGTREGRTRFLGTYGVARDISERKRNEAALAHHAFHDALTGLPNRTLFGDRLSLAIAQAQRHSERVAVLFIDLDRFKLVNDTHGHVAGDQLLQQLAQRLRHSLRAVDTVSRLGGDEFTAVVPGVHAPGDAETIARKLLQTIGEPVALGDIEVSVSASIGIALYPDHATAGDELLRQADLAMYRVKRSGKNGIAFFEPAMRAKSGPAIALENDLRRAVRRGELEVHYQPVLDANARAVESVEALVRWRHPRAGLLPPSRFIHLAEDTGLASDITAVVLAQSLGHLASWRAAGLPDLRVAVNVSAREFQGERFIAEVVRRLDASGLPPDALELEITENVLIEDLDAAVDQVERLRRLGIRVSIDDFGTRYSSLGYLHRLPVNTIKIDQSFVHGLTGERTSSPIVSAIVAIARGFGFDLVAEGVESEAHVQALRALGCMKMQGFHFRSPEPAALLGDYLRSAGRGLPRPVQASAGTARR